MKCVPDILFQLINKFSKLVNLQSCHCDTLSVYCHSFSSEEDQFDFRLMLDKEYMFSLAIHYLLLLHQTWTEAVSWILEMGTKCLEHIIQTVETIQLETKLAVMFCAVSLLICLITCIKGKII